MSLRDARDDHPPRDPYYAAFLEWKLAQQEFEVATRRALAGEAAGEGWLRVLRDRLVAAEARLREATECLPGTQLQQVSPPRDCADD